ncbi:hypothetical protein [Herbihabitans rhizosphaerae]|uniref:hypothetical protein n=1 Tax=Herbihabitans rhizosphaerae TaxID=1872711 RepID=UPI00102C59D3|nr:hypothetical protein [Herbihabitans rhizosphaerae]
MTTSGNSDAADSNESGSNGDERPERVRKQRPALPKFPGLPSADDRKASDRTADAPRLVMVSFWLWFVAGAAGVLCGILLLAAKSQLIDELIKANKNASLTPDQIESGTTTLVWMIFLGTIVFAALFALFAYKARQGVRSSRTILTVLAVITVLFFYLLFRHPVGLLSALLALIATVLMYTPQATEFYKGDDSRKR